MAEQGLPRPTLLLVDVQQDFLDRPGLSPNAGDLLAGLVRLLDGARRRAWPIIHVRTRIATDGSDRMPHWQRQDIRACVAGTPGYAPPPALAERPGEPVLHKGFFSAFSCPELAPLLEPTAAGPLVVAGLYTHGCIRATVLDAYARGYAVLVADDAVGSTEPIHAELSRAWLDGRAARFLTVAELLGPNGGPMSATTARGLATPAPVVGRPRHGAAPSASAACAAAAKAAPGWAATDPAERAALLERWADRLAADEAALAALLAREVAKPVAEARDELRRTLAHIRIAARLAREGLERPLAAGVCVRYRPVGTVGLITPWNNPLAIPAGKLAPALACGNACVWKPSPLAPACSERLLAALSEVGLPAGLVQPVAGDASIARAIVTDARVDAVSLTGSSATGQAIAALCAASGKPLQAELGGNNAALILDDWAYDDADLAQLARAAFGFAGQRCTAIRRLIVQRGILDRLTAAFAEAVRALPMGDPLEPATIVGPLISAAHQQQVQARLDAAIAHGARVLARARLPADAEQGPYVGRWLAPALLDHVDPGSPIAQQETFGPVALILPADDLDQAIAIANGVRQGLVSALYSADPVGRQRFAARVQAGMLKLSPGLLVIDPEAPFCGWKASALGPPEHGAGDRDFYARAQAVYL